MDVDIFDICWYTCRTEVDLLDICTSMGEDKPRNRTGGPSGLTNPPRGTWQVDVGALWVGVGYHHTLVAISGWWFHNPIGESWRISIIWPINIIWLVTGTWMDCFSIGNVIIPIDELIFFRGVGSTTNQICLQCGCNVLATWFALCILVGYQSSITMAMQRLVPQVASVCIYIYIHIYIYTYM